MEGRTSVELDSDLTPRPPHVVAFAPPLASTIASREHAFDADGDELDDDALLEEEADALGGGAAGRGRGQSMAMLGLLQQGARRGSVQMGERDKARYLPDEDELGEGSSNGLVRELGENGDAEDSSWLGKASSSRVLDHGASLWSAVSNMSNSILGAGIIGLPYAVRSAGFVLGAILICLLGYMTDWTIRLIAINSKLTGRPDYIGIMESCFGKPGKTAISFFQFAFAFGGMCAFEIIVGDTIPHVLSSLFPFVSSSSFFSFLFSRTLVILFFTLFVSYPLSLHRDIAKLSKASALALISMVVIVVTVAVRAPGMPQDLKGDPSKRWTVIQPGLFEAIGVISFAFVCHHNSLLIYGSLRTPTLDRFARVIHLSTALSVAACLVMSFSGFLAFTDKTQANILNNFPNGDLTINIARLCFGLNMFTTLPLECFVCRETLETYFYPEEQWDSRRHFIITTALVGVAMLISLVTCDLGIVLELTGGFAASALAFVFPAACSLKVSSDPPTARRNLPATATVAFGVTVMIIATASSLFKGLDPNRPAKICSA